MHHAGEGMVGERALAQHLAARGRNLVVVLYRAAADADCSEQYAVLDDRQNSRMPWYQRLFAWFLSFLGICCLCSSLDDYYCLGAIVDTVGLQQRASPR